MLEQFEMAVCVFFTVWGVLLFAGLFCATPLANEPSKPFHTEMQKIEMRRRYRYGLPYRAMPVFWTKEKRQFCSYKMWTIYSGIASLAFMTLAGVAYLAISITALHREGWNLWPL